MANILLVGDDPNWAFGQTIASMKHYYKGLHKLQSAWTTDMDDLASKHQHAHLIVAFCIPIVNRLIQLDVPMNKIIVGIRGMGDDSMPSARTVSKLAKTQGVICANILLFNIWKGNHEHVHLAYEAADLRYWFPKVPHHSSRLPLVIGWNGNSSKRYKNYHEIFIPLIEQLEKDGIARREVRDRDVNGIQREQMREKFYYKIDMLAMVAFREGNPYPLYEAMACGVPCISSYAGIAPELITDHRDGWVMHNATVDMFYTRILQLASRPNLVADAGKFARDKIVSSWCWERRINEWSQIFDMSLKQRGLS